MKADCYKCKFRGRVPGDAHSCCDHPLLVGKDENEFGAMVQAMSGQFNQAARTLNIKAHDHGIRMGWFAWPANFDPVWLLNCDGFETKEEKVNG